MLDLDSMRIIRREKSSERRFSFVGMRVSPTDNVQEFWLPQGFQAFPANDFDQTVGLFFDLYKVIRSFTQTNNLQDQREGKRDPLTVEDDGLEFTSSTDVPIITFSKLNILDAVLDTFDEMVLSAVISKEAMRHPESHEQVHRYLHQGTYLDDDRIYFDQLPSMRPEVILGATALVGMFCFVYVEIARQLKRSKEVSVEITGHAEMFKIEHLSERDGLFDRDAYKSTIATLKELLERIDRTTPYKDDDYWQLFNALEIFLYGDIRDATSEDGIVWGVSDFHPIWEAMAHAYAKEYFEASSTHSVVFADTRQYDTTKKRFNKLRKGNPFCIEMNGLRRTLAPDLVAVPNPDSEQERKAFQQVLVVSKGPIVKKHYSSVSIRIGTARRAKGWLTDARKRMANAGWHEHKKSSQTHVSYQHVPSKRFDTVMEAVYAKWLGKRSQVDDRVFIIDFKYMHPNEYCGSLLSPKIEADILKQNVYELAYQYYDELNGNGQANIASQFIVPLYSDVADPVPLTNEDMPPEMQGRKLNAQFVQSGIELIAIPFRAAAVAYTRLS